MNDQATNTSTTAESSAAPRDNAALALKSSLGKEAHELTDNAKHLVSDVADRAKQTAESSVSSGKQRAVEGLESVAQAIRKTGENLRAEDQGAFTGYFDRAARGVDTASEYLESRSLGQVIRDVEQFARREPAIFLGGAFVAGLVGGRFLKSAGPAVAPLAAAAAPSRALGDGRPAGRKPSAESSASTGRQGQHGQQGQQGQHASPAQPAQQAHGQPGQGQQGGARASGEKSTADRAKAPPPPLPAGGGSSQGSSSRGTKGSGAA